MFRKLSKAAVILEDFIMPASRFQSTTSTALFRATNLENGNDPPRPARYNDVVAGRRHQPQPNRFEEPRSTGQYDNYRRHQPEQPRQHEIQHSTGRNDNYHQHSDPQRPPVRHHGPPSTRNNDQPASGRQAANRHGPQMPRDPTAARRVDVLWNNIFKYARLRHHLRNWVQLPPSLKRSVDGILHVITPPGINDDFRFDLADIGKQFVDNIASRARQHIVDQLHLTASALRYHTKAELQLACQIADRHLIDRLPRLKHVDRLQFIGDARDLTRPDTIDASTSAAASVPHATSTQPSTDADGWQTQKPKHHRSRVQFNVPPTFAQRRRHPVAMDTLPPVADASNVQHPPAVTSSTSRPVSPVQTAPATSGSAAPAASNVVSSPPAVQHQAATPAADVVVPSSSPTTSSPSGPSSSVSLFDTGADATCATASGPSAPAQPPVPVVNVVPSTSTTAPVNHEAGSTTPANRKRKAATSNHDNSPPAPGDVITITDSPPAVVLDKRLDRRSSPEAAQQNADRDRLWNQYVTTDAGVHVYTGNKDEWSLAGLSTKDFVVIADSNLRQAASVPAPFEVFCMPGARLRHLVNVVKSFTPALRSTQAHVILQIGVNNRDDCSVELDDVIEELQDVLLDQPYIAQLFFIGVSYPADFENGQKERLDQLNDAMMLFVGLDYFVEPLPETEVEILPHDRWGIHHTPGTINRILEKTCTVVNKSLF